MDTLFDRRIKVFVSSTYTDLAKERKEILDALWQLPRVRPIYMEGFGAFNENTRDVCLGMVEKSHVYLGILGNRYGSIDKKEGKSYTHLEYERARRIGLPCYIYFLANNQQTFDAPNLKREREEDQSEIDNYELDSSLDLFSDYDIGAHLLLQRLSWSHSCYREASELSEQLKKAKRKNDGTQECKQEQRRIVNRLARLARGALDMSFIELCRWGKFKEQLGAHTYALRYATDFAGEARDNLIRDLGVERVSVDVSDALRVLALLDSPVDYYFFKNIFGLTVCQSTSSKINDIRAECVWEFLKSLLILREIRQRKYNVDRPLQQRQAKHMLDETHREDLNELCIKFLEYFQKHLDFWNDRENVRSLQEPKNEDNVVPPESPNMNIAVPPKSPEEIDYERYYISAFRVAYKYRHPGHLIDLAKGLSGIGCEGFFTYWGDLNKARRYLKIARAWASEAEQQVIDERIVEIETQLKGSKNEHSHV